MRWRTRKNAASMLVLGLGAGWACGASIIGSDPETGLSTLVTRGPLLPVAREGEVNEEPVDGAALRVRAARGSGSIEARTAADGTATFILLPGDYEVAVTDCPGSLVLPATASVNVVEGRMEALTMSCDTGIR